MGFPGSSAGKESTCKAGDPSSIPGLGRSPGEEISHPLQYSWASLVAQLVKNPPAMWETWVWYAVIHSNVIIIWKTYLTMYCYKIVLRRKNLLIKIYNIIGITLFIYLATLGIPDHLTCLLRNLYAGQEATVRNWTWNNRLVPNRLRSMSRLYIVTLLI